MGGKPKEGRRYATSTADQHPDGKIPGHP